MKLHYLIFMYLTSLIGISTQAQTYNAYHNTIASGCSQSSVDTNLQEYVNFGIKSVGSTAIQNSLDWLKAKYQSYGYTDIVEQEFTASGQQTKNLIITKQGSTYPNTYVIVDAHYDSINGVGANDNGSGTVALLEMAKQMANIPTAYSIKFIHFSAEEIGLIGSQYYVDNTVIPQNMDIKLVLNIDEIGGINGQTNDTIVCERDTGNPSSNNAQSSVVTNQLATCIGFYSTLNTEISYAYSSDYMTFENNGEIITGLFEKNQTPYRHTPNDIIANMDTVYVYEVIKGATGALAFFAEADQALSTNSEVFSNLDVYPIPADKKITVYFGKTVNEVRVSIFDINGKTVFNKFYSNIENSKTINTEKLQSGIYVMTIDIDGIKKNQKIQIK
ncbi:M20/M25/M40 family metallo-hydrolase [Pseudofulvibacter geojedonensis]|uniref:M20/M25/M40 family metallo-hydrolase n=1 Tax=Pseudofulvibacter geojedonensis TaxID=1123758 RepID=A0ABW3HZ36_9FLAO